MKLFFGKRRDESEQQPQLDLPAAILKNKEAIGILEKRHTHIEKKIQAQENEARNRIRTKDKRGAMLALRRKKMYEAELESLENSRLTLEQQILTLESAQTQQVAVGALATGVVAQKQLNQQMNVTKIDKLMEDMHEQSDQQKEVAQVLSQGAPIMDDDELLAELEEMEALELDRQLATASTVPSDRLPEQSSSLPSMAESIASAANSQQQHYPHVASTTKSVRTSNPINTQLSDEDQLKALMGELA
eukprot:GHVQ01002070.1.p1 GENE.GHVQ01002070.1~~GHVQ01002070.1.p1  ORF type:complete len:247 (+),score=62.89 GHVQ01002070.1:463-1203(+)